MYVYLKYYFKLQRRNFFTNNKRSMENEEEIREELSPEEVEEATPEATEEPQETEEKEEEAPKETEETPIEPEDQFFDNAKKFFPDAKDEKQLKASVIERLSDLELYYHDNQEANKKVMEVLEDQPEIGEIIRDMAKGATFSEALARHIDVEGLQPAEGDPDFEVWDQARKERKKRQKAAKEFEVTLSKNRQSSVKNIETFREEKKLSEDDMGKFTLALQKTLEGVMDGHITQDFLNLMYKALNFEVAVTEAQKQGEVKGRNEKITAMKDTPKKGDGLPHVASQGTPEKKVNPIAAGIVGFQKQRDRFNF